MKLRKILAFLSIILLITGFAVAYTGSSTDDSSSGGSGGGGGDTGGDTPEDDPSVYSPNCYDGIDNDDHNGDDDNDQFSCVKPFGSDHIEGSIWDTDLTTTMNDEAPSRDETISVFYAGSVEQGNDNTDDSGTDSGSLTEYYITEIGSESDNNYSFGKINSIDYSGFPAGTTFNNGRAIDPPNNLGSETCGDGYENDGGPTNDAQNFPDSQNTDCRADYGRLGETYDVKDTDSDDESNYLQDGMACRPDVASCETTEKTETDSSTSCSCTASVTVSCSIDTDYTDDENHDFWYLDGDYIYEETCTNDGGSTASKSDDASCSYSHSWTYSCSPHDTRVCPARCSDGESDSDSDSAGDKRSWEQTNDINCNNRNVVDGGGETSGDDSSPNKADNDPAGTYTEFTAWGNNADDVDRAWCAHEYTLTVDADGPQGNGDGFVVVHEGSVVATESPDGSDSVGQNVWVDGSNSGTDYTSRISTSCQGDKTTCLKYVDFQTVSGSGDQGDPDWTTASDAVTIDNGETTTYTADESYSVCKKINSINEKNGDGTELIDCDYERGSVGSEDVSPLPEAGGDEPNEHLIIMEGPAVDNSVTQDYLAFEQKVVNWEEDTGVFGDSLDSSACVTKGKAVSEGTVAPIQTYNTVSESFEMGTPSPDWEVCLNLDDGTGDDQPWDNAGNDPNARDFGGEWYDFDDERINDYLRGSGNNLITGGDSDDINDIAYYWRTNPNPQHSDHNPTGGESGVALEDDCDPALAGCDTTGTTISGESGGLFYGTFEDFTRDEDYHPQSQDGLTPYGMEPLLEGHLKRLKQDSNQLEPGMDTDYSMDFNDPDNYWFDTRGGEDYADQYGYVDERSDAISNRGKSRNPDTGEDYRPGKTYARTSSAIRDNINSDSVEKTQKVFGNSIVVESTDSGPFQSGEGYWLDPDDLEAKNSDFKSYWWDLVRFNIDLTGPDSGLGYDDGSDPLVRDYETKQGSSVIKGGIYWQDEDSGGSPYHEGPICGDDQLEFLVEEMGASENSGKTHGRYACVDSKDKCVTFNSDPPVIDLESYAQAGENAENAGRLKQDKEICLKDRSDEQPKFWDQDYGDVNGDGSQDTCNVNNLYGSDGVRWLDEEYVTTHPHAVTGGIDDDWNEYLNQLYNLERHDQYTSKPDQDSWNFGSESPVPSGVGAVGNDSVATLGFCGGDDDGEFLITQECNSNLCETDRDIVGVAKNPDSCVIDEETMSYDTSVDERKVFEPGKEITVNLGGESRQMTCFDNNWFDEYPIIFNQQNTEVPFGESTTVSFHIINVRDSDTTFEVEMLDPLTDNPSAYQHSRFVSQSGNSFETTVGPQSSETFYVNIDGANKAIGDSSTPSEDDLTVRASAVNSDMNGEDSTTVEVVENNATNSSVGRTEPKSVPGIGAVHVMALVLISSVFFFLQS